MYVRMCVCACMHACIHVYHTYVRMCVHMHCMRMYVCAYVYTRMHICMYVCTYVRSCVNMHCVCMHDVRPSLEEHSKFGPCTVYVCTLFSHAVRDWRGQNVKRGSQSLASPQYGDALYQMVSL